MLRRKYIRPQSMAALWSPRCGGLALCLLGAVIFLHHFEFISAASLPYFIAVIGSAALISLLLAAAGLIDLWRFGAKGGMASLGGLALALPVLALLLGIGAAWLIFPPLYDISTDLRNPPIFLPGQRPDNALPPRVFFTVDDAAQQSGFWPDLSGRRYEGSPDNVLRAVKAVLKAERWPINMEAGAAGESRYIYVGALAKTPIMGFSSDIIIRITDEGDTSFVDVRAAARSLLQDFGIDARESLDFLNRLDSAMLLLPDNDAAN